MKIVLVVEDTDDLRNMFTLVLNESGYRAIGAPNGRVALELIESLPRAPDLVLADLMMPVMDGLTFIAELQASRRWSQLPVVVLSATETARVAGARRLVKKPVDPASLLDLVEEFCGSPSGED